MVTTDNGLSVLLVVTVPRRPLARAGGDRPGPVQCTCHWQCQWHCPAAAARAPPAGTNPGPAFKVARSWLLLSSSTCHYKQVWLPVGASASASGPAATVPLPSELQLRMLRRPVDAPHTPNDQTSTVLLSGTTTAASGHAAEIAGGSPNFEVTQAQLEVDCGPEPQGPTRSFLVTVTKRYKRESGSVRLRGGPGVGLPPRSSHQRGAIWALISQGGPCDTRVL